jgi:hypothetical protein
MNSFRVIQFTLICCTSVWMPTVARAGLIAGSQLQFTGNGQFNTAAIAWRCNLVGDAVCSAPLPTLVISLSQDLTDRLLNTTERLVSS